MLNRTRHAAGGALAWTVARRLLKTPFRGIQLNKPTHTQKMSPRRTKLKADASSMSDSSRNGGCKRVARAENSEAPGKVMFSLPSRGVVYHSTDKIVSGGV